MSESKEIKTKRFSLLLKPSVYNNLKKIAVMEQTSVNELIGKISEEYIRQNHKNIKIYDQVFNNTYNED